ncbi:MAG: hypothetical protein LBV53_02920 [Mycoplasmataceae bacterium]|jgi:mevalonate pyrophosphate decarboxylase|nr:hypothetical protein [Mycoplasmataceae bacterium]
MQQIMIGIFLDKELEPFIRVIIVNKNDISHFYKTTEEEIVKYMLHLRSGDIYYISKESYETLLEKGVYV